MGGDQDAASLPCTGESPAQIYTIVLVKMLIATDSGQQHD